MVNRVTEEELFGVDISVERERERGRERKRERELYKVIERQRGRDTG